MTQFRTQMLEELRRRNYSPRTAKTYVRIVGAVLGIIAASFGNTLDQTVHSAQPSSVSVN